MTHTDAAAAHSWRLLFQADGRPYLTPEFPWGRDPETRRRIYRDCVDAGVMSPGSNVVRDRLDMASTWVDLGEWLLPRAFLLAHPFETRFDEWDWFNIHVEDRHLPSAVAESGMAVAPTQLPTLHYYLGGYTNNTSSTSGLRWARPHPETEAEL